MSKSCLRTLGVSNFSPELYGLCKLTPTLRSNGKSIELTHVRRIYKHILGNCLKKDLNFRDVVLQKFGLKKLVDLLSLLKDSQISVANGKEIMMRIIDGDERMPTEIAANSGFTGEVITSAEVKAAVDEVVNKNPQIVQKILKTGNEGPVMSLVGKVMEAVNRRGDPVAIKSLIHDKLTKVGQDSQN